MTIDIQQVDADGNVTVTRMERVLAIMDANDGGYMIPEGAAADTARAVLSSPKALSPDDLREIQAAWATLRKHGIKAEAFP